MHKYIRLILLFMALGVIIALMGRYSTSGPSSTAAPASTSTVADAGSGLIKAVHYFASGWPKTFWEDFEQSQVDEDFARIKADGFNTIILVVPWLGFETGFENGAPDPSPLYDRLEWLLRKIDQTGLGYALRVSFPHSFDTENGVGNMQLCREIFVDSERREAWLKYISRIGQQVDRHREAFRFAFFSWEDFFCPYTFPGLPIDQRIDIAKRSGFQDWLNENFPRQLVEFLYLDSFDSMAAVPIPESTSPASWFLLHFVDQFLVNQLLMPARQFLPELAMEVRVDRDRTPIGDEIFWTGHDLALSDDRVRSSYWGPYYGAQNQGEELTASQALQSLDYMLNAVSGNGTNINHVVEQFNFIDNTPGFARDHAKIKETELPAFLEGSAALFKEKSRGYGLWAYRDYVDSAIYNGSFEMGLRGWDNEGAVSVITNDEGDRAIRMQANTEISQAFAPFEHFINLELSEKLTFCANFKLREQLVRIKLSIDGTDQGSLDVGSSGNHCKVLDVEPVKKNEVVFSFSSDAEIEIDDLRLYTYIQRLDVYDENGLASSLRDLIVRFNKEWLED